MLNACYAPRDCCVRLSAGAWAKLLCFIALLTGLSRLVSAVPSVRAFFAVRGLGRKCGNAALLPTLQVMSCARAETTSASVGSLRANACPLWLMQMM